MLELEDHVCLESEIFKFKHENEVAVGRSDCQLTENLHHLLGCEKCCDITVTVGTGGEDVRVGEGGE